MKKWSSFSFFVLFKRGLETDIFLIYMLTVILFIFTIGGLSYMKIGNFYQMVDNNGTDIKTLCFHIFRITTISLIISYNVIVIY